MVSFLEKMHVKGKLTEKNCLLDSIGSVPCSAYSAGIRVGESLTAAWVGQCVMPEMYGRLRQILTVFL